MLFLRKRPRSSKKLVAGSGVYICNECIELCSEIVEEELAQNTSEAITELPTPKRNYGSFKRICYWSRKS